MYRKNSSVHVLSALCWVDFGDKLNGEASKLKRDRAFVFLIPFADFLMYSCDRWRELGVQSRCCDHFLMVVELNCLESDP